MKKIGEKFGEFIVKNKAIILIISLMLSLLAVIGIINTKINYNILVYLPKDIETMKGQDILENDFNLGSFSIIVVDNMSAKDVLTLEDSIKKIDSVNQVESLYDLTGTTIPIDILPDDIQEKVIKENSTLVLVTFKNAISDENTLEAVKKIRTLTNDSAKVGGMSAMVLDTQELSSREVKMYVLIAVLCCILVLMITLDSYFIPFLLLLNIGVAIIYNMGSNIILGNISYITKAISSILQLGVTADFSIFLYHQYEEEKKKTENKEIAMSKAISETLISIIGSSTTTIAGFLALCTMQLTLGIDIGVVMAKGVLFGVICVVTIFPSLILFFNKLLVKTSHKPLLPEFKHIKNFVLKKYKWIFAIFLILIIPAWWGNKNVNVYYNLDKTLPTTLSSIVANSDLKNNYNIVSPMIILASKDLNNNQMNEMIKKIEALDNIDFAISYSKLSDLNIPDSIISNNVRNLFESNKYQIILINSTEEEATEEATEQINKINEIIKDYDKNSILAGEAALLNDLVEISDTDFHNVNYTSLAVILIIIFMVLKSYSLPVILVSTIEFAIFANMSISYYTGSELPFIASIVIGTIQLGATIDYAILMTTKYLDKRKQGKSKITAIKYALDNSVNSIFTSGMCFFAATFGVGLYSKLEMVGSLCTLIARGAIISMLSVILILPSILLITDKIICKTTKCFKKGKEKNMKNIKKKFKLAVILITGMLLILPININALTKDETVYVQMDNTGLIKNTIVSEHLINDTSVNNLKDYTTLMNIVNTNGNEIYTLNGSGNILNWASKGKDIYYQGESDKTLPISMNISYIFNGEKYTDLENITGKDGHVEIKISFTNNSKYYVHSRTLYTPFTVALAAILNNEENTNIKVNNGTIIDNGKTSAVSAIAMPGLSRSLQVSELENLNYIVIEYDTTNFDTLGMYCVVTPKFLNTSAITSNLNQLYSSIQKLSDASNELINGSEELYSGLVLLNSNYKEFDLNLNKVSFGTNQLTEAYINIDNAIQTINGGVNDISDLSDSIQILKDDVLDLANISQDLNISADDIMQTINNVLTKVNNLIDLINKLKDSICSNPDDITCQLLNEELEKLNNDPDLIKLNKVKDDIDVINNKIEKLKQNIPNSDETIAQIISDMKISSNQLAEGSTEFYTNLQYLNSSLNTLVSYSGEMYGGTTKLTNGAGELKNGIIMFNEDGIQKLVSTVNNVIKPTTQALKDLYKLSENYTSFTGNGDIESNTKFIIKINK